jgi:hypothetical protein
MQVVDGRLPLRPRGVRPAARPRGLRGQEVCSGSQANASVGRAHNEGGNQHAVRRDTGARTAAVGGSMGRPMTMVMRPGSGISVPQRPHRKGSPTLQQRFSSRDSADQGPPASR